MRNSRWVRLLAYVTGSVNQELLLRNEYLAAENRILRAKLPARLRSSNPERATLSEIGKRLGRRALADLRGQTRYDPGMVPETGRQEIRLDGSSTCILRAPPESTGLRGAPGHP